LAGSKYETLGSPLALITRLRFLRRQTTLLFVLIGITTAAFFLTRSLAAKSRSLHRADAMQWHQIGAQRLAEGDTAGAITALRHAAAGDRENREVALILANAHRAAGDTSAARDVLLQLRERLPDDADINLRLARLERNDGRPDDAVRYYQSALLSLWGPQQLDVRRQLRIELIEFLLENDQKPRALSESLLLAGEIADTPADHVRVGTLLLRAGDAARALSHFETALERTPRDADARSLAGEAAYLAGNYRLAARHLGRVPDDRRAVQLQPIVDLIVGLDPLAPGLSSRERHRRVQVAAATLSDAIASCAPGQADVDAVASELDVLRTRLRRRTRTDDPVDSDLFALASLSDRGARVCGTRAPIFRALELIAEQHGGGP
jgi:tetratricopeptide (TPR) repeat protein